MNTMKTITRPLRSLLIGDISYYPSEYAFGVDQGMSILGHWHTYVDIRFDFSIIKRKIDQVQPDIIWGHMLLWAPGEKKTEQLLQVCEELRARGTRVVLHDGDARTKTRYPRNISKAIDLILSNNTLTRHEWGVRQIRWPYFAFNQRRITTNIFPEFACDLAFAGRLGHDIYGERTAMIDFLKEQMGDSFKVFPNDMIKHTLFRTNDLASSAKSILGYGRSQNGWTDVRVFQYPGAGGVLLHDDVQGYLEPYEHYIPYESGDIDSIMYAVEEAKRDGDKIRPKAFRYVQKNHSSLARVKQVLKEVELC